MKLSQQTTKIEIAINNITRNMGLRVTDRIAKGSEYRKQLSELVENESVKSGVPTKYLIRIFP
jgi:CRISPR/Cas system CSM-associated protein Csm3 (group 7 of RAMP superfamily)